MQYTVEYYTIYKRHWRDDYALNDIYEYINCLSTPLSFTLIFLFAKLLILSAYVH